MSAMDASIRAKFRGDRHVLGPFLGNLPPEILDVVVRKLGWFQTTFAMAGRTCREAVERVPSTRAVLTEEEREILHSRVTTPEEVRRLPQQQWMTPLAVAVVEGDLEALEWLMQLFDGKGHKWRDDGGLELSLLAAERGKIASLTCLRANGCPWDEGTCANAAYEGHLEVLQWAHQNGCPWDAETCAFAAGAGHLDVLQWARQNGCPWNEMTCYNAAGEGHLEVLQWARQNRCPWDAYTCTYAADGGHLEVLQWAHQNGCPWDANTWYHAKRNCLAYLREHGCPGAP